MKQSVKIRVASQSREVLAAVGVGILNSCGVGVEKNMPDSEKNINFI